MTSRWVDHHASELARDALGLKNAGCTITRSENGSIEVEANLLFKVSHGIDTYHAITAEESAIAVILRQLHDAMLQCMLDYLQEHEYGGLYSLLNKTKAETYREVMDQMMPAGKLNELLDQEDVSNDNPT